MAELQDVDSLKRRGRRRLVGAIALVLVAVIVLPWIFDPQPAERPPVSVRVPSEDESPFKPRSVPPAAPPPAAEPKVQAPPEAKPEVQPSPAPESRAALSPPATERTRAEAALANVQFVFQVGAYADPGMVIGKLKAAKIPYFTEPVATDRGTVTRVRAGPYASREAAEKALKRIRALGFKPGSITERS
ncbi:MAG: SPOR domain-containing protein [Burkholderiales bacterium]